MHHKRWEWETALRPYQESFKCVEMVVRLVILDLAQIYFRTIRLDEDNLIICDID